MVGKTVRIKRKIFGHRQGSAALITTIAISSILVVLFVGITTITTRQIRQSINSDNANRALYAAEAGVEDAARRLANDPTFTEPTCNESAGGEQVKVTEAEGAADVAWTCRTVTQTASVLTGRLDKDEALQLNLSRSTNSDDPTTASFGLSRAHFMTIEWNNPQVDSLNALGSPVPASSFLPSTDPTTLWNGRAAALEVTATWLPNILNATNMASLGGVAPVRTVLASPINSNPQVSDFSPLNNSGYPANYQANQGVAAGSLQSRVTVNCNNNSSASYNCKMPHNANTNSGTTSGKYNLLDLMKTQYEANYVAGNPNQPAAIKGQDVCNGAAGTTAADNCVLFIRLKARYNAASYSIRFYDKLGNQVFVPDGYATIDVTARSNNYFRRVVAKKKLSPGVYEGIFDNALFSGRTICKTMQIYKDFRGAPERTGNPSQPNPDAGKNVNGGCTE